MFRGEYTLPWTQLEQNLKEWKIEMINWPKDVERDDSIKGIHGLADTEVRLLWNAIPQMQTFETITPQSVLNG